MGGGQRGTRWTQKEDRFLLDLMGRGVSETTLIARMKRSSEAIRMRLLALRKEQPLGHLTPTPELPDDTPIDQLRLPPRIKRVLLSEGLTTVASVREASDGTLLSFVDFGQGSLAYLRTHLGLRSEEGVRPLHFGEKSGSI